MSSQLSNENTERVEKAIKELLVIDGEEPSISMQYFDDVVTYWNKIQKTPQTHYFQFASNAMGMTSYGFYKAKDNCVYIVEAFMNNITRVYTPTNKMFFMQGLVKESIKEEGEE